MHIYRKPTPAGFMAGGTVVLRVYRRRNKHVLTRVLKDPDDVLWVDRPEANVDHGQLKRAITAGKSVLRLP